MKRYTATKGVEMKVICGEHFLIAHRDAWNNCPVIFRMNETAALLWKSVCKGTTVLELAEILRDTFAVPLEQAEEDAGQFCETLCQCGYCAETEAANG